MPKIFTENRKIYMYMYRYNYFHILNVINTRGRGIYFPNLFYIIR